MWDARMTADVFLTSSSAEAAQRSEARRGALANWKGSLSDRNFDWVGPPILNPYTRLAVTMCPARAILRAAGYDEVDDVLPKQVTNLCEVSQTTLVETASS